MTHWTERAFLERPEVLLVDMEDRVEDADEEVADLLALLADEHGLAPEAALDVACGIGRHSLALADRGLAVTGLDISPAYLGRARERAADHPAGERVEFVRGDMRRLGVLEREFDLLVNAWTSFGYFEDDVNRAVLSGMRERVADGGACLLELANKEGVLANFDDDGVHESDGRLTVESREYDPATSRMRTEREVFEADGDGYEHLGTLEYDLRAYGPAELRERLLAAGFGDVSLYATLDGEPLRRESTRLVAVARP